MLRHEEPNENPISSSREAENSAAQVRVTAEEFARAVARHQARREEAAKRLEGTVSLGEAVQELNIDITPEELLAEVQAARAEQAGQAATVQEQRRPRPTRRLLASAGLLAVLTFGIYGVRQAPAPDAPATAIVTPQSPTSVSITVSSKTVVQDTRGGNPVLRILGEVPDGVPVRCGLAQTNGQATFCDFSNPNSAWTLIKHGGRVYVRGWIPNMSAQAIAVSGVTLYNQRTVVASGVSPIPVTLAVDGLQCAPGQVDDEMIVAQKVQTDEHFRERW